MHRLLIVDDEHHIVDWLMELFAEKPSLDLELYKAYTGEEALKILDEHKIDLVLADIKMPGLDGFALADRIFKNWPKARIIFLTGYDAFDYAYKANQYKNVRYLLKTEDDEVIVQTVSEVIDSINEELKNSSLLSNAINQEKIMHHLLQKYCLFEYIRGQCSREDWNLSLCLRFPVLLLLCKPYLTEPLESDLLRTEFSLRLQQIFLEHWGSRANLMTVDTDSQTFQCILQPCGARVGLSDGAEERLAFYLKETMDNVLQVCHQNLNCEIVFLLHQSPVSWNLIQEKWEVMNFVFHQKFESNVPDSACAFICEENLRELSSENQGTFALIPKVHQQFDQLQSALEQNRKDVFQRLFASIQDTACQVQSMHYLPAIELYLGIVEVYLSYINRFHLMEAVSFHIGLNQLYRLDVFASWKEAFRYLDRLGNFLFQLRQSSQDNKSESFIKRIKSYITGHLDTDLSLSNVSNYFNYNPSYISRLFKQKSGINLSDYVTNMRMQEAKRLLSKTNASVQTIAHQVGFDSPQYFSTVFKKNIGVTPQEYRSTYL